MWRNIASNALTLIIVGLVVAIGGLAWAQRQYSGAGPLAEAMCLQVPQGGTMSGVADDLTERGAVSSGTIFRLGADYSKKAVHLKAGSFLINPGASMAEIIDDITDEGRSTCGTKVIFLVKVTGQETRVRELDPVTQQFAETASFDPKTEDAPEAYLKARDDIATEYEVTVVEGVTSWQIVEALKASGLFDINVEETPEEGTLASGSYEIRLGQDLAAFLAELTVIQAERLARAWENRAANLKISTPEEAMILASIIEKETSLSDERPIVSSVLQNRLAAGSLLQFDPTIIYGITRGVGSLGRPISNADISGRTEERRHGKIEYNTYQIHGLPAGPIGNPGEASIVAAVNPAETNFLFFVADGNGGHAFAETLNEHNENVARWRRIEAERANQ